MEPAKMGQGMMVVACVLGLGLLTMFFAGVEERQYNPNAEPQSARTYQATEVILHQNRAGHYVVTGTINSMPVDFLLDTGATEVVIPETLARELGLNPGRKSRAMTANGMVTVYDTVVSTLTIGDITLHDVPASINPAMPEPILLGMSALRQIEFVQRGEQLTLRQIHD